MKRIVSWTLAVAVALLFVACSNNEAEMAAAKQKQDSLQAIIDNKDAEMNSMFEMLNQIEQNLAAISAKYGDVQQLRQKGVEGKVNVKNEISDQINNIESMLQANKAKIAQLNKKLADLGKQNTELQEFVSRLEARIEEQESQILTLTNELAESKIVIEGLHRNVSELTAANSEKDQTIAAQIAEANKAYFVVGDYDELKAAGIVAKQGGFIGIGRRQTLVADMPLDQFVQIDLTKTTTITINMRNAVVLSNHPDASYELVNDEEDHKRVAYLRILNPAQFWQRTKYLVVSTD